MVGHDRELFGRKEHRQKPVVLLLTGMLRVDGSPFLSCAPGAGRPVVTVRYVAMRYLSKAAEVGFVARDLPHRMSHPVGCGEVVERGRGCHRCGELIDLRAASIREEHR